jgi:hypothetical protein
LVPDAIGTWQYHRPLPEWAHVSSARLMRRLVADKDRWSQQLVLRPADLLHLPHAPTAALAAVHFGSMRSAHERRVATIAHSADPAAVHYPMLPASVDDDLAQSAELQSQRAKTRDELLPRLQTLAHDNRPQRPQRPPGLAELWALDALPRSHISFGRILSPAQGAGSDRHLARLVRCLGSRRPHALAGSSAAGDARAGVGGTSTVARRCRSLGNMLPSRLSRSTCARHARRSTNRAANGVRFRGTPAPGAWWWRCTGSKQA